MKLGNKIIKTLKVDEGKQFTFLYNINSNALFISRFYHK